jgi:hypothetical protein
MVCSCCPELVHFTETSLAQIEPRVAFINTEQCVQLCWSQEAVTGAMIGNVTRPHQDSRLLFVTKATRCPLARLNGVSTQGA